MQAAERSEKVIQYGVMLRSPVKKKATGREQLELEYQQIRVWNLCCSPVSYRLHPDCPVACKDSKNLRKSVKALEMLRGWRVSVNSLCDCGPNVVQSLLHFFESSALLIVGERTSLNSLRCTHRRDPVFCKLQGIK